ncbi:MAG: hypothetical protein H6707_16820 [Deltaproteobacteria bacterium]|nr:hypothetical protein [Deltaproteobacteria bacterium]
MKVKRCWVLSVALWLGCNGQLVTAERELIGGGETQVLQIAKTASRDAGPVNADAQTPSDGGPADLQADGLGADLGPVAIDAQPLDADVSSPGHRPTLPGAHASKGAFGTPCQRAVDCEDGPCVAGGDGNAYCSRYCVPGQSGRCPGKSSCTETKFANVYVCASASATTTNPPPAGNVRPSIDLRSPTLGQRLPTVFSVEGRVIDDSESVTIEVFLDNLRIATTTTRVFSLTVEAAPGEHQLRIVASDGELSSDVSQRIDVSLAAKAPLAGSYGQACNDPGACISGLCVADTLLNLSYCTQVCEPAAHACPSQSKCLPATSGMHICAPSETAQTHGVHANGVLACAAVDRSGSPNGFLVVLLVVLLAASRTRIV